MQSTLQVVLEAHSVVQPALGQDTAQGCEGEPQANWHVPPLVVGGVPAVQAQVDPSHEHCAFDVSEALVQVTTCPPPPLVPPPP